MRIDRPSGGDRPDEPDRPDRSGDAHGAWLESEQPYLSRRADRERQAELADRDATAEELVDLVAESEAEYDRDVKAEDQLDRLPERQPRDKTRGLWEDADGLDHELVSGRDDYETQAADMSMEKTGRRLAISSHVEVKFAMMMREKGLSNESIAVNQRPCRGELGCDTNLPMFLPTGGSLTVYGPEEFKQTYRGESGDDEQR